MTRPQTSIARLGIEQSENILNAAERVLSHKGSSATMSDIASEAGVSQGLAYRYFRSKEEILSILVKRASQSGGGLTAGIARIKGSPGTRLKRLISGILEHRRDRPEYYSFVDQMMSDERMPEEFRKLLRKNGRTLQNEIRKLIIEGQASGEVVKDDPDKLVAALIIYIIGTGRWISTVGANESANHFPDAEIALRMVKPVS